MALTKKRRVFIEEYLRCWNGAEAARRAGYKFPGRQAFRLLRRPAVREEVDRRISELKVTDRTQVASKVIRKRACFVYLIRAENGLVKIGKTVDIASRFRALDSASPIALKLIAYTETVVADELEEVLHACFEEVRARGEWFRLSEKDIEEIKAEWGG